MDDHEKLTAEALRRFESQEAAQSYLDQVSRRNRVIEDHERRLITLELGVASVQSELKEMAREAHEARIEQGGLLKAIGQQVETIARDQTIEAGRRQGAEEAASRAERLAEVRRAWARSILPFVLGMASWMVVEFFQDIVEMAGRSLP